MTAVRRSSFPGLRGCSLILCSLAMLLPAFGQQSPVISFGFDFPGSRPEHYSISVSSNRHTTYESSGKPSEDAESDDSFQFEFEMSPSTCQRIFALAARAHYFDGSVDSKHKGLAFTGTKTLTYQDGQATTRASYNVPAGTVVQDLTSLFQNLSTTMEFGHRLQYSLRYQKLALDEELKRMEEVAKSNGLEEMVALTPILQAIANDPSVINPVRSRARRLLERGGSGESQSALK